MKVVNEENNYNVADILESVYAYKMKHLKIEDILEHYSSGKDALHPKRITTFDDAPIWMRFLKENKLGTYGKDIDLPF